MSSHPPRRMSWPNRGLVVSYTIAKKNHLFNLLKFILWVPLVVITAIFVTAVDCHGLEWLIGGGIFVVLLWIYRVSYSFNDETLDIRFSFNLLGFYFATVKVKAGGVSVKENKVTREKLFSLSTGKDQKVLCDFSKLHKLGPQFKVEKKV